VPDSAADEAVTAPRKPRAWALLFAPLPGIGHWMIGRAARGLFAFVVFTLGVNLVVLSRLLAPVTHFSVVYGFVLAGIGVLYSIVDVARLVFTERTERAHP
jgi:hypothetical protein